MEQVWGVPGSLTHHSWKFNVLLLFLRRGVISLFCTAHHKRAACMLQVWFWPNTCVIPFYKTHLYKGSCAWGSDITLTWSCPFFFFFFFPQHPELSASFPPVSHNRPSSSSEPPCWLWEVSAARRYDRFLRIHTQFSTVWRKRGGAQRDWVTAILQKYMFTSCFHPEIWYTSNWF